MNRTIGSWIVRWPRKRGLKVSATAQSRSMRHILSNNSVAVNSAFLIANTVAGSAFGFLFWSVAARTLPAEQVGIGAAYISILTYLVTFSEMGLGTTITRFAPSMESQRGTFINSAIALAALIALVVAAGFALGTPWWAPQLRALSTIGAPFFFFVLSSVCLMLVQLIDRVFVAFQAARFMFLRNVFGNVIKTIAIILIGARFGPASLVVAVGIGASVTFAVSSGLVGSAGIDGYSLRPALRWSLLRGRVGYSIGNHLSILAWAAPTALYPLIVVALLGGSANARFYVTWMIANLLFVVPNSVCMAVFARAAGADRLEESAYMRIIGRTSGLLLLMALPLLLAEPLLMRLFGGGYGSGTRVLFIYLVLSAFPYLFNSAVITLHRFQLKTANTLIISAGVVLTSLALSIALGARYGLSGVGAGWFFGQALSAGVLAVVLRRSLVVRNLTLNARLSTRR